MDAIANGITLYGGLKTFTGAFLVFSDYMKPAIRMAAVMKVPTIFIFTPEDIEKKFQVNKYYLSQLLSLDIYYLDMSKMFQQKIVDLNCLHNLAELIMKY